MKRIFLLLLLAVSCTTPKHYIKITGYAQGGTYQVSVNVAGVKMAPEAIRDSIEAILFEIDTTLSGYNKGSMLSRFNAGEAVRPSPMFLKLYDMSVYWHERSGGALDMAAGPLFDAWGFGFKNGSMPSAAQVDSIRAICGMGRLVKDLRTVVRPDGLLYPQDVIADGSSALPRLNYNAIAQGYTSDAVAAFLYRIGAKDMLVDIGEIWCDGLNPSGKSWTVGVDSPTDGNDSPGENIETLWESGGAACGVVTSGNYRKFYIRDGKKYAHTIDPLKGYPVEHSLLSATVVSSNSSAEADAVATWCMVAGPEGARSIIDSDPALEGCLITATESDGMDLWRSKGF